MISIYYQKIVETFINRSENYIDYYLCDSQLKQDINNYIEYEKCNLNILNNLDQCMNDSDCSDYLEDENNELLTDEQKNFNSINHFINELKQFYNFEKNISSVIEDIKEILNESIIEKKNRCIKCNHDLGINNPRQLCGKWRCYNEND